MNQDQLKEETEAQHFIKNIINNFIRANFILLFISFISFNLTAVAQNMESQTEPSTIQTPKNNAGFFIPGPATAKNGTAQKLSAIHNRNSLSAQTSVFGDQHTIFQSKLVSPYKMISARVDQDTLPDLILTSPYINKVVWYKKTQNGFSDQKMITDQYDFVSSLYAADLKGDARSEIVAANENKIVLFQKTATGFKSNTIYNLSQKNDDAPKLTSGDIDNDGDPDLVATINTSHKVVWFENTNNGFASPQEIYTLSANDTIDNVLVTDVDHDGDQDLIYSDVRYKSNVGKTSWVNHTSSGFASTDSVIQKNIGAYDLTLGDVDGDKDQDLIAQNFDNNFKHSTISIYYNKNGHYTDKFVVSDSSFYAARLDANDIDQDGEDEIFAALELKGKLKQYNKFNYQHLSQWMPSLVTDTLAYFQDVTAEDFDGDGLVDVASTSFFQDDIVLNTNNGQTYDKAQYIEDSKYAGVNVEQKGDFDGDGNLDIALGSSIEHTIYWAKNNGGGYASANILTKKAYGLNNLDAKDLDNDGDLDLVASYSDSNEIVWFENTGSGFRSEKVIASDAKQITDIYSADLNGDNLPEILYSSTDRDTLALYKNTGSGFGSRQIIDDSAPYVHAINSVDADGDGDQDLLAGTSNGLDLYRNTLTGFKSAQTINSSVVIPDDIAKKDFDGDGDLDIVTASGSGVYLFNNRDNDIVLNTTLSDTVDADEVAIADVNLDGKMDVIAGNSTDNRVMLMMNNSLGFSSPKIITSNAYDVQAIETGDIDGDGDPDLIAVTKNNSKLAWYENTSKTTAISESRKELPDSFKLESNYPNPFNPTTRINYAIPHKAKVRISVYNTLGRKVTTLVNRVQEAGHHSVKFDASHLSSGVYLYRLQSQNINKTQKMMLLK